MKRVATKGEQPLLLWREGDKSEPSIRQKERGINTLRLSEKRWNSKATANSIRNSRISIPRP